MDSARVREQDRAVGRTAHPAEADTLAGGPLSVSKAAERLGVSRSVVWQMIADGRLDTEVTHRSGRVFTRVQLPRRWEGDPDEAPPQSRTARLQDQVERLTTTLERLTAVLQEANRERCDLRQALRTQATQQRAASQDREEDSAAALRLSGPAPAAFPAVDVCEKSEPDPVDAGLRANPLTRAPDVFGLTEPITGDDLLDPVRELFKARQRPWWQRLPLVSRG